MTYSAKVFIELCLFKGIVMQIVELLINGSYVFEVYVTWKSRLPIICTSALIRGKICHFLKISLGEKCPNTEISLVRIFLYSDWIQFQYTILRTRKNSVFGHFSRSVWHAIYNFL